MKRFFFSILSVMMSVVLLIGCSGVNGDSTQENETARPNQGEQDNNNVENKNEDKDGQDVKESEDNPAIPSKLISGTIIRVVDGDTFHIRVEGMDETVRLLLVDTPETEHPSKPVEPFGPESHQFAEEILPAGKKVKLELDGPRRGKYDRLLTYLWVDGKMFNELLLEKGLARLAYVYDPPYNHYKEYMKAQNRAKSKELGIWSIDGYVSSEGFNIEYSCKWAKNKGYATNGCHYSNRAPEQSNDTSDTKYDPNGPDRDCGDFDTHDQAQNFFIAAGGPQEDPHRLDREGDGLACESLP